MPLKLTAGISKKLGLPGYSSVGAICHVELELDSGLIQQAPAAFHAQVREVYAQCAESVDEELTRQQALHNRAKAGTEMPAEGFAPANGCGAANRNGNGKAQDANHGHDRANGHGSSAPNRTNGKARSRPSARQLEFAQGLAGRLGMDAEKLNEFCQRLFEKSLAELSGGEASGLIRALEEMREGWLGPDAVYRPEGE
jgi:hypothetical protein